MPGLGPSPDDGGTAQISACRSDHGAHDQCNHRLKVGWQVYSDSAHRLVSASHRICVGARRGMTTRVRSYGGDGDTTRWRAQESPWKHGQTHTNTNFYARPHCEASDWERPSRTTNIMLRMASQPRCSCYVVGGGGASTREWTRHRRCAPGTYGQHPGARPCCWWAEWPTSSECGCRVVATSA